MNRRNAITSITALVLAGCTGEAVLAQGSATIKPTEAEIWADPTAHGVMPIEYMRNELLRMTADAVLRREESVRDPWARGWIDGEINGYALALRLMGVSDNLTEQWARDIVAALGRPMSELTDTHWCMYPGNDAWRLPVHANASA